MGQHLDQDELEEIGISCRKTVINIKKNINYYYKKFIENF